MRSNHEINLEAWYGALRRWLQQGQGWGLWDFAVDLEPVFRSLPNIPTNATSAHDDARISGGLRGLISGNRNVLAQQVAARDLREPDAPAATKPPAFYRSAEPSELCIQMPRELDVTPVLSEQLYSSLGRFSEPIAFELIANSDSISIQLATDQVFAEFVTGQLKTFLPSISVSKRAGFLKSTFAETRPHVIIDFGLSKGFSFTLSTFKSFNTDPLAGLLGALSNLNRPEKAAVQVLFKPVRYAWVDELMKVSSNADFRKTVQDHDPALLAQLKDKLGSPLFAVSIRLLVEAEDLRRCWVIAKRVGGGLGQFADPSGNELIALDNKGNSDANHRLSIFNRTSYRSGMLLNAAELSSIAHFPSSSVQIEKLNRVSSKTKAMPALASGHRLTLGTNTHDGISRAVTLSDEQRTRHVHIVGSTGSGKSTLLLDLVRQDIDADVGVCVLDPAGDLVDAIVATIPQRRIKDVVLFDPSDSEHPIGLNILRANSDLERTLLSSDLVAAFRRMSTSWGDLMDAVLANAVLATLEKPDGTLFDLKRFLVEKDFRNESLKLVRDEAVRYFWSNEFPLLRGNPQSSILIRLDAFLRQRLIRNIVCQRNSKLNFREIMDERKILLVKLSQGMIGIENSHLLGTLFVTKLHQIALSRQDANERPFFAVYIDEFHNFIVPSIEAILSGIRKYNISLTLSHQEFRQLQSRNSEVASSVLSNCYTRICFRLGDADADRFAGGFTEFDARSLQNLGIGEAICRIERAEYDFNLKTRLRPEIESEQAELVRTEVQKHSRQVYAASTAEIERDLTLGQTFTSQTTIAIDETMKIEPSAPTVDSLPDLAVSKASKRGSEFDSESTRAAAGGDRPTQSASPESREHRYLQKIVKRIGEDQGFVAVIEKAVFGGIGKVDVALENEGYKLACEIAVTNTTEYEVQNIRKCLSSGFDQMVVLSTDTRHLKNIRKQAELVLSPVHLSKVHFLEPENFHLFLESLAVKESFGNSASQKIRGFTVTNSVRDGSDADNASRKDVVSDILLRAARRRSRAEDE